MNLSVSTQFLVNAYGDRTALKKLREIGYAAVDFTLESYPRASALYTSMDERVFRQYFSDLKKYADEIGMTFGQTHAHIPTPLSATAKGEREMFSVLLRDIIATASLGCPYIVIHPAVPRACIRGKGAAEARKLNAALFSQLKPVLLENGVRLAVENMFNRDKKGNIVPTVCSTPEEMLAYIGILGDEAAVACLDVGHANLTRDEDFPSIDPIGMISALGDKLKILHLHDNNGLEDQHYRPGKGNVPWDGIMRALAENGFCGNLSFELKSSAERALEDAKAAFDAGEEFLCRYFSPKNGCEK